MEGADPVLAVGTKDETVSNVADDARTTAAKLVIADWYFIIDSLFLFQLLFLLLLLRVCGFDLVLFTSVRSD